jgi:hypothetical protein
MQPIVKLISGRGGEVEGGKIIEESCGFNLKGKKGVYIYYLHASIWARTYMAPRKSQEQEPLSRTGEQGR